MAQYEMKNNQHSEIASDGSVVFAAKSDKRPRGLLIAVVVLAIIALILLIVVIVLAANAQNKSSETNIMEQVSGKRFSLSDEQNFYLNYMGFQWDQDTLYYIVDKQWMKFNTTDLKPEKLPRKPALTSGNRDSSSRYVLTFWNIEPVYRHSQIKDVILEDTMKNKTVHVVPEGLKNASTQLQHIKWSPVEPKLVFVYNNQLHLVENIALDGNPLRTQQITNDPSMIYGISDWLYEEEIFGSGDALWWSDDGKQIAYLGFDESAVTLFKMPIYGNSSSLYGSFETVNYPKAGETNPNNNPLVFIYVRSIISKQTYRLPLPPNFSKSNYIEFVRWYDNNSLLVAWVDRRQEYGAIYLYNSGNDWQSLNMVYETTQKSGWVDLMKNTHLEPIMHHSRDSIIIKLTNPNTEGEFRNLAVLKVFNKASPRFIHNLTSDVDDIKFFSSSELIVYYVAAGPLPTQRNLYSTSLDNPTSKCLTCDDPQCTYSSFYFSVNGKMFVQICNGPRPRKYILRKLVNGEAKVVSVLLNNDNIDKNAGLPTVKIETLTIHKGTSDELDVYAKVLYPPGFINDGSVKYPFLLKVYAGPGVQMVNEMYRVDMNSYMSSSLNFIIASVDVRGTPFRGRVFENALKGRMGQIEIEDQYAAVEEIAKWKFIDKSKIAVNGWSYGGFAAGHLLGYKSDSIIRCAIAGAPVTDFRQYDTAYTERYAGLFTDQKYKDGYNKTNIANFVQNFKNKEFLLIHGTGDDNVHFLNSAHLISAMVEADIDFEVMVYPDADHSASFARRHINRMITRFLVNCMNCVSSTYSILDSDLHKSN